MKRAGWPVRVRLTALYAGAFLAAGSMLVAVTYWLVSRSLSQPIQHRLNPAAHSPGVDAGLTETARQAVEAYRSDALGSLLGWSLLALTGALVVAIVLGWALARRAMRPLRHVTETANRVAHRSLHERIALEGPEDEIKELADTFDAMLERLDRSFDAQRRFVANASHELRTPLATNRTTLEVALAAEDVSDDLRRLAPTLLDTNDRSERLIEGLLTLARSEHEVTERTDLDLADLAEVAVRREQPDALERGITLATDLHPAPVSGSLVLLERLAINLVENAVRHSPRGVVAVVRTGLLDDHSLLEAENPGPVVDPHEVEEMFEPFRRLEGRTTSQGVGLGLSIVRSVALAHGGRVSARPRESGGLVIRVELPIDAPQLRGETVASESERS